MMDLERQLNEIIEKSQREQEEKWNNMTSAEKIEYYKEKALYSRYCRMTIEELEEEKEFNKHMYDKLIHSKFSHPEYSAIGCDDNIRRINTILKLKKECE